MTVDASDFKRAAQALTKEGFEAAAGRTVAWALRRSANVARRNVRLKARPHRKTGHMASNIRVRYKGAGIGFTARVWAGSPVAHLISGGVKPHETPLVNAGALTIRAGGQFGGDVRSGGTVVALTKGSVHSPGFPGDPFFATGVDASRPEIGAIFQKSADTMVRELAYRISRRR